MNYLPYSCMQSDESLNDMGDICYQQQQYNTSETIIYNSYLSYSQEYQVIDQNQNYPNHINQYINQSNHPILIYNNMQQQGAVNISHNNAISTSMNIIENSSQLKERRSSINTESNTTNEKVRDRSDNWSIEETRCFVRVILNYKKEMKSLRKNCDIWTKLPEGMYRNNFKRDEKKCKNKWKSIIAKYKKLNSDLVDKDNSNKKIKAEKQLNSFPFSNLQVILDCLYEQTDEGLVKKLKSGFVKDVFKDQIHTFRHQDDGYDDNPNAPIFTQFQIRKNI